MCLIVVLEVSVTMLVIASNKKVGGAIVQVSGSTTQ